MPFLTKLVGDAERRPREMTVPKSSSHARVYGI